MIQFWNGFSLSHPLSLSFSFLFFSLPCPSFFRLLRVAMIIHLLLVILNVFIHGIRFKWMNESTRAIKKKDMRNSFWEQDNFHSLFHFWCITILLQLMNTNVGHEWDERKKRRRMVCFFGCERETVKWMLCIVGNIACTLLKQMENSLRLSHSIKWPSIWVVGWQSVFLSFLFFFFVFIVPCLMQAKACVCSPSFRYPNSHFLLYALHMYWPHIPHLIHSFQQVQQSQCHYHQSSMHMACCYMPIPKECEIIYFKSS